VKKRTAAEQKLADDARLLRAWRKWHRDQLKEALARHPAIVTHVVTFVKDMTPASANALLELMRGATWADVDADTKLTLLHLINEKVTQMREQMNLEPIDDGLPGARPNAFRMIRAMLFP
jgi:multisubunit Na+/H+ antiporter MnhE subunit